MKIKLTNPFNKKKYELVLRPEFVAPTKPQVDMTPTSVTIKNTFVGAYYLAMGGNLASVRKIRLTKKKAGKKGYPIQWIMTIANVPKHAINLYQSGKATCSVDMLANCRRKLKREIYRLLP